MHPSNQTRKIHSSGTRGKPSRRNLRYDSCMTCSTLRRCLPLAAVCTLLLLGAAACDSDNDSPTQPSPSTTETFSGTLTVNGAVTFPINLGGAGTVTATIGALAPNPAVIVGLSMGVSNGVSCTTGVSNDTAVLGTTLTATTTTGGGYCVRIYDVGRIGEATTFAITVIHP